MSRLDWKRGRFSPDLEVNEIEEGFRGYTEGYGDHIEYFRFLRESSTMHDIYDEGTAGGRVYNGPIDLPCLQVIHEEAGNEDNDTGFYYNERGLRGLGSLNPIWLPLTTFGTGLSTTTKSSVS